MRLIRSGGSGGGTAPIFDPGVSVSASTISSGGALDWHGRAAVKRRPSDDALVLCYQRSSGHAVNDGGLCIRFSDDDGATWTAENTDLNGDPVPGFPMNPPDATANQDAGEPWLYVTPDGDLVLHMWRIDYQTDADGSYQSRSTDGGLTWSTPTAIDFSGIAGDNLIFSTDDDFVFDRVIYAGARKHNQANRTNSYVIFIKSTDDGATWEYVSDITAVGSATQEVGLEYVGNGTIVAVVRSLNNDETVQVTSTDMGATWGTPVNVDSPVGVSGRHRIYTRSHLQGHSGWWKDPVLFMCGFILTNPGSSQGRRNCIWISPDRGTTWDGPHYTDTAAEDGGYGDLFWDHTNSRLVFVSYRGTLGAASLKQYDLALSGL